jgi:hypothetical protein
VRNITTSTTSLLQIDVAVHVTLPRQPLNNKILPHVVAVHIPTCFFFFFTMSSATLHIHFIPINVTYFKKLPMSCT